MLETVYTYGHAIRVDDCNHDLTPAGAVTPAVSETLPTDCTTRLLIAPSVFSTAVNVDDKTPGRGRMLAGLADTLNSETI